MIYTQKKNNLINVSDLEVLEPQNIVAFLSLIGSIL